MSCGWPAGWRVGCPGNHTRAKTYRIVVVQSEWHEESEEMHRDEIRKRPRWDDDIYDDEVQIAASG